MKLSAALTFFNVPVVLHVVLQEMRKCETLSSSHVFQCPCSTPRSTTGDEKV